MLTARSAAGAHEQEGTRRRVDGRETRARHTTDTREVATQVDGVARNGDGVHGAVRGRVPRPQRTRLRVERGDAGPGLSVHGVEVATDEDRGAVGRRLDLAALRVQRGRPGGDEVARDEVVGEDVRTRGLVRARRGAGRTGLAELAGREDTVPDDHLVPDDPVDLHRRQRRGRHGLERRVGGRGVGPGRSGPPPGTPTRYAAATPNATAATRNRFGPRTSSPSTYGARCRAPDIHVTRLASGAPTAAAHRQNTAWRPRSVTRSDDPSFGEPGQLSVSAKSNVRSDRFCHATQRARGHARSTTRLS